MLSPSQIRAIHALSLEDRKKRYLELANKLLSLVVLTPNELQEQTVLRELFQGMQNRASIRPMGNRSKNFQSATQN